MGDSPNESVAVLVISEKRPFKEAEKPGEGRVQVMPCRADRCLLPDSISQRYSYSRKKRLTVRCTVTKRLPFGVNKNINIAF